MSDPYTGEIRLFSGPFAPVNWHFCDGSILSSSDYKDLEELIETLYGGTKPDTFALPDLRGRVPVQCSYSVSKMMLLGWKGGDESVELYSPELPSHNHAFVASSGAASSESPVGNVPGSSVEDVYTDKNPEVPLNPDSVIGAGGSKNHPNMSPYVCLNYIICLFGEKPK